MKKLVTKFLVELLGVAAVMLLLVGFASAADPIPPVAPPSLNCVYVEGNILSMLAPANGELKIAFRRSGYKTAEIMEAKKPDVVIGLTGERVENAGLYKLFTSRVEGDLFPARVSLDGDKLVRVELPPFAQSPEPPEASPPGYIASSYSLGRLKALAEQKCMVVFVGTEPGKIAGVISCRDDGKFPWKKAGEVVWLYPDGKGDLAYSFTTDAPAGEWSQGMVREAKYEGYSVQCGPNGCRLIPNKTTGATGGTTQWASAPCVSCQRVTSPKASCGGCAGSCSAKSCGAKPGRRVFARILHPLGGRVGHRHHRRHR